MKIQFVSDLHLEFPENREWLKNNPLLPKGDVLLLAGDTVSDKYKKKAKSFFEKTAKDFPFIISTMGNHEFYHGIIDYAYPFYKSNISARHIRLNNRCHIIDNVKFIVSVLWSNIAVTERAFISERMNDYRYISHKNIHNEKYPVEVADTNLYHELSVKYIREELNKPFNGKVIVMTHHLPSYKCISERPGNSRLNSAYASDLDELIVSNPQIKYWVCGHAHDFNLTRIGNTSIIRNPLGYVFLEEERDFKRDFVVEV